MRPLVIVGAPRSGTNLLRDVLAAHSHAATWPCDELNPMWLHHNVAVGHDELGAEHAAPKVRRYVRRRFGRLARKRSVPVVVEKTCANALRLPFVGAVLPKAQILVIERTPFDAIASIVDRWTSPQASLSYLLRKAQHSPPAAVPRQAVRTLLRGTSLGVPRTWGPRYEGIDQDVTCEPVEIVAARQWYYCVTRAREAIAMDAALADRTTFVAYERLLEAPVDEAARAFAAVGLEPDNEAVGYLEQTVDPSRGGHGTRRLGHEKAETVRLELVRLGWRG